MELNGWVCVKDNGILYFILAASIRNGGHDQRTMHITPSRYNWQQYKDLFHFYFFLGVIPLSVLTFFINIFVGPATLEEVPPGYIPKHWEYHWVS